MDPIPSLDLTPEPVTPSISRPPARPGGLVEDPAADAARDAAFSAEFTWDGKPLQPFSIERYTVFLSHRTAMGAPPLSAAFRDGLGFYPDALRLLWLCATQPGVIRAFRSDPEAMENDILQWAAVYCPIASAQDAVNLAVRIWNAAHENKPEPRESGAPQGRGTTSGN